MASVHLKLVFYGVDKNHRVAGGHRSVWFAARSNSRIRRLEFPFS